MGSRNHSFPHRLYISGTLFHMRKIADWQCIQHSLYACSLVPQTCLVTSPLHGPSLIVCLLLSIRTHYLVSVWGSLLLSIVTSVGMSNLRVHLVTNSVNKEGFQSRCRNSLSEIQFPVWHCLSTTTHLYHLQNQSFFTIPYWCCCAQALET